MNENSKLDKYGFVSSWPSVICVCPIPVNNWNINPKSIQMAKTRKLSYSNAAMRLTSPARGRANLSNSPVILLKSYDSSLTA